MTVHVDVIEEKHYIFEIDVPEEKEDEVYENLSCQPCMDDELAVGCAIKELGYSYKKYNDDSFSRVETWR